MAKSKNSRLEIIVAIGTVVFMFLLVGFFNAGEMNFVNQVFAPQGSAEESAEPSSKVSDLEPVQLPPAISEFTVMGS